MTQQLVDLTKEANTTLENIEMSLEVKYLNEPITPLLEDYYVRTSTPCLDEREENGATGEEEREKKREEEMITGKLGENAAPDDKQLTTGELRNNIEKCIARAHVATEVLIPVVKRRGKGKGLKVLYFQNNSVILKTAKLHKLVQAVISTLYSIDLLKDGPTFCLDDLDDDTLQKLEMLLRPTRMQSGPTTNPEEEWTQSTFKEIGDEWQNKVKNTTSAMCDTMATIGNHLTNGGQRTKARIEIANEFQFTKEEFQKAQVTMMSSPVVQLFEGEYHQKSVEDLKEEVEKKDKIITTLTTEIKDLINESCTMKKEHNKREAEFKTLEERYETMQEEQARMNDDLAVARRETEQVDNTWKKKYNEVMTSKKNIDTKYLSNIKIMKSKEDAYTTNLSTIKALRNKAEANKQQDEEKSRKIQELQKDIESLKKDSCVLSKADLEALLSKAVKRNHQGEEVKRNHQGEVKHQRDSRDRSHNGSSSR
jgi:hypothetical protein